MNDKIKELLENAEKSDAIARNKWRIENREQLRKERKEKLKELMEKDKQQTAVEWQYIELSKFLTGFSEFTHKSDILIKAKEMEKEQHVKSWEAGLMKVDFNEYYNETYGGDK
jgi:hypothetical protein